MSGLSIGYAYWLVGNGYIGGLDSPTNRKIVYISKYCTSTNKLSEKIMSFCLFNMRLQSFIQYIIL